jgi:pimeloyl-ACP methyl ester carboxylesterase
MDIMIRTATRNNVPLLEMWRQDIPGKRPLVLAQHGYLGRKEFLLPQAYLLAASGFFTVVPDACSHGDRDATAAPDLFASARCSARDINALLDTYAGDERADLDNAGFVGYSMGGMIGFYYLTLPDVRFKAVCPVIASPDWEAIALSPETRMLFHQAGLGTEADFTRQVVSARQDNPVRKAITPVPLLIQAGADDPLIPAGSITRYADQIRPLYQDGAALEVHIYPGQGHADTIWMNQRIVAFLTRHLGVSTTG